MPSPPSEADLVNSDTLTKSVLPTVPDEKEDYVLEEHLSVKARFLNYWKNAIRKYNLHFYFIGFQISVFLFFQILNGKDLIFSFDIMALVIIVLIVAGSFIVYALKLYPYDSPVDVMIEMTPFFFAYYSYSLIANLQENVIYPHVHLNFPYKTERFLFEWMFGGKMPNEWFESVFKTKTFDIIAGIIYTVDMGVPIIVCIYYFLAKRRKNFELSTLSILLMGLLAQITFVVMPTAPPWYIKEFGFSQPWYGRDYSPYAGGGLSSFDELTGFPLISMFYSGSSDYFAAFPSMHAGFTFITLLIAYNGFGKKSLIWTIPFNIIVYIIAVYSYHHYLVDLIGGMIYATVAFFVLKFLMKRLHREEIWTGFGFNYT